MISIRFATAKPVELIPYQQHMVQDQLASWLQIDRTPTGDAAATAISAFTRARMQEAGFFRRIMPPVPIDNDMLERELNNDD